MDLEKFYNKYVEKDNIIYSIDMIRLKTYISYSKFTEIEFRFATCWQKYLKKNFNSSQLKNFFYNYVVEIEEGVSFWFGFLHNTEKRNITFKTGYNANNQDVYNLTIEFNPNKLKNNEILMYILSLSGDWAIKSYDLAIDLKVNILDLLYDMNGRNVEKIDNRGLDNKTIYIGKGDGRVKIYNKKNESKLNIREDLTRIEISREVEDFEVRKMKIWQYDGNFPIIYMNNYMFSFSDYKDKTLLAILYAVQNGFPLRDLSRAYRKKIKELYEGNYKIKFDKNCARDVLNKTIYNYFLGNNLVHFW